MSRAVDQLADEGPAQEHERERDGERHEDGERERCRRVVRSLALDHQH